MNELKGFQVILFCSRTNLKNIIGIKIIQHVPRKNIQCFTFNKKVIRYAKKQENRTHTYEKNQLLKNDTEITKIIVLVDKYIKIVILTLCLMFTKLKEILRISRNMKNFFRGGIKILEMTTQVFKVRNT